MTDTFTLNTGAKIPAVGLGTWQSAPGEVAKAVEHALNVGYRHIDCAFAYGNEGEVGSALKKAFANGVKREDVFITTKLWCTYHRRVEEGLDKSLKALGLDFVDSYLMHWPQPMNQNGNHPLVPRLPDGSRDLDKEWDHIKAWKAMEKLLDSGKVKAIGVCNYSVKYLEQLLPEAKVVPAVNQIENHPYLPQQEIDDLCKSKGIHITAYSPFGSTGSPMFQEQAIQGVAKKHGVKEGTVLLSYAVSKGHSVIPKSVAASRIEENMKIIKLDSSDMQALEKIHKEKGMKRFVYPDFGVDLGFPDKS